MEFKKRTGASKGLHIGPPKCHDGAELVAPSGKTMEPLALQVVLDNASAAMGVSECLPAQLTNHFDEVEYRQLQASKAHDHALEAR